MDSAYVQLWLPINDVYKHALSIPPVRCQDFSVHPLTWLRYIAFTIYGGKGHISTTCYGPPVDYYQPDIQPGLYYYVLQEPFMLLLDPDLMDDRTTDSSSSSVGRADFRDRIVARDETCIMTGEALYVEACHIVPHSKGDPAQYITYLMDQNRQDLDPPLHNINDTRNGILLSRAIHPAFGTSHVAFLQTPNFAMAVTDVALVKQPSSQGLEVDPQQSDCRLTLQHFNDPGYVNTTIAPHNSDARRSNSIEWPPPIIFDVSYGSAVLKAWGKPKFINETRISVHSIYYDNEDGDNEEEEENGDDGDIGERGPGGSQDKKQQQRLERQAQARADKRRGANDSENLGYSDLVLGLWVQNARKNVGQAAQASAMTAEKTRTKVQTWLESTKA